MKYLISLFFVFSLSGCLSIIPTPVKRTFPDPVPALMEQCPDLQQIVGDNVSIADLLKVIINNYNLYYQCANKVDGWKEWYEEQKKIFNSVK
jgi:starvation-inducible outer membrane lipoprotein